MHMQVIIIIIIIIIWGFGVTLIETLYLGP